MNLEEKILELIKEKPMLISVIEEKLGVSVTEVIDAGALPFLRKYGLAEIAPTDEGGLVKITPKGLQLLNFPKIEDELPSDQLEALEKLWGNETDRALDNEMDLSLEDKTIEPIYTPKQHTETANWLIGMATRFDVSRKDVICALWLCAKDAVWARLERDVKENRGRKGENEYKSW